MNEAAIRQQARQDYREDRCRNPYKTGTWESLWYNSEAGRILKEELNAH